MIILKIILWTIAILIIYRIVIGIIRKMIHFPAPAFISIFLDSKPRGWLQPPKKIISYSKIKDGDKVLEIGSGSGFFTLPVARALGPDGKIAALDIQQEMLDKITKKLDKEENTDVKNIKLVKASAYEIPYPAESFDVVFTVSVLQEIPDPHEALMEARRVLKKGGVMSVSEFIPDPDWPFPSTVEKQLKAAGFKNIKRSGNLLSYTVTGEK
jgi:ubiquinone/menaquinone biosynthesis C-methylase UbiE